MIESDVIIVGGGVVGLLTALSLLKKTHLSVALLDERKAVNYAKNEAYSPRISAITLQSKQFFSELGVWQHIIDHRVSAFNKMQVWEEHQTSSLHFDADNIGKKSLGYIIENDIMQGALHKALSQYAAFQCYPETPVQSVSYVGNHVLVLGKNSEQFRARLVIGADGAESHVRHAAGIDVRRKPYDVTAIVATVKTEKPHEYTARQVFLKTGPLAFLPLENEHYSSIVWSLPSDIATEKMQLDDLVFNADVTHAFASMLGDVTLVDQRYAFPLVKQEASSYIADKIVLVGDAAHVVHPLAGQGVNLGILDAQILCDVIVAAIKDKRDIGSYLVLRRYERAAKTEAAVMIKAIDGIHHLFVEGQARYSMVRQMGMKMLESCGLLKRQVMRVATGSS